MGQERVSRRNGTDIWGRTCIREGRWLVHWGAVRLEEEGEGEEVVAPVGEVGPGGVVEPGGVVGVGEDRVHGWWGGRGRRRGPGYITGTRPHWPQISRGIKTPSG